MTPPLSEDQLYRPSETRLPDGQARVVFRAVHVPGIDRLLQQLKQQGEVTYLSATSIKGQSFGTQEDAEEECRWIQKTKRRTCTVWRLTEVKVRSKNQERFEINFQDPRTERLPDPQAGLP